MKALYPIFILLITFSFLNSCTKIHILKKDKSSLKEFAKDDELDLDSENPKNDIQSKSQDLSENEIVSDISTHFTILNQGSQDTFFNVAWKPIAGAVNYKLFQKKLKTPSFDAATSQYNSKDSKWSKVVEIPAQSSNDNVYQYKHMIHNVDREYGEIIPLFRSAYRKYQYTIEGFDANDAKIAVNDDIKDAFILPDNPFVALNDIDHNLIHSLIISGGFLSKDFAGDFRSLDQIKPKPWNSSTKGPVSGTHTITKNANEDSIEYKWDHYNAFDTINISGTLQGKLEIWKRDDAKTRYRIQYKGSNQYHYQGLMIVLNGTLNITGMYEATLEFKDYRVIDDTGRMRNAFAKLDAGKTGGNLVITYNGKTETIEHNKKSNLYASNGVYKSPDGRDEPRDYNMKSRNMDIINDYRKKLGLPKIEA